ncbi:Synaphin [Cinara cedri]|uniref:Synaphin n=1 Tax=Cinara cedri TaxID=506608 RepID=A0A5E4N0F1_9HEMI|nr:Synaphin [Cinara cedri]
MAFEMLVTSHLGTAVGRSRVYRNKRSEAAVGLGRSVGRNNSEPSAGRYFGGNTDLAIATGFCFACKTTARVRARSVVTAALTLSLARSLAAAAAAAKNAVYSVVGGRSVKKTGGVFGRGATDGGTADRPPLQAGRAVEAGRARVCPVAVSPLILSVPPQQPQHAFPTTATTTTTTANETSERRQMTEIDKRIFAWSSSSFKVWKGAVGDGGESAEDKEKNAEAERERLEAIREAEERRKEKHRKMEEEREKMRQEIRDKYNIKKKEELPEPVPEEPANPLMRKKKTPEELAKEAEMEEEDEFTKKNRIQTMCLKLGEWSFWSANNICVQENRFLGKKKWNV